MSEEHDCPRREPGPWRFAPGPDRWVTDRWTPDKTEALRRHAEADAGLGPGTVAHRGPHNDLWLWPGPVPRTCSYCGSVHPEDALRLLEEGWELELAKSYKLYVNPPGALARLGAFLEWARAGMPEGKQPRGPWSPVPPVKLYTIHCTPEQVERLNVFLDSQRVPGQSGKVAAVSDREKGPERPLTDEHGRALLPERAERVRRALSALMLLTEHERGLVLCWFCRGCGRHVGPGDACYCERDE